MAFPNNYFFQHTRSDNHFFGRQTPKIGWYVWFHPFLSHRYHYRKTSLGSLCCSGFWLKTSLWHNTHTRREEDEQASRRSKIKTCCCQYMIGCQTRPPAPDSMRLATTDQSIAWTGFQHHSSDQSARQAVPSSSQWRQKRYKYICIMILISFQNVIVLDNVWRF